MQSRKQQILVDTTLRLIRRGARANIQKILSKTHPADVAAVFRSLVLKDQRYLFDLVVDDETRGEVLCELGPDQYVQLLPTYEVDALVPIFSSMSADDVADILGNLPEELADAILERMETEDSEEVEDLMRYGDDTAGGIMVPDCFALPGEMTAEQAVQALREAVDVEMAFYVYVTNDSGHLVGVVSLRQLVTVPPSTRLSAIMADDVISVRPEMDQEEVARLVARYNFLALPVVDHTNKLLGIVTVDDVIDVIRAEATEDFLKMAGAGQESFESRSVWRNVRARFPWLVASCIGGLLAALIMSPFEEELSRWGALALFIPVVLGMGGNVGTQSSTVVVRSLAMGLISLGHFRAAIGREVAVGILLGIVYGIIVGTVAGGIAAGAFYGVVVGLSLTSSMVIAAIVGATIPLLFERLHIDPAVATGPFVTTSVDILGILTYFSLAVNLSGLFPGV